MAEDKMLKCRDCGAEFAFTAEEQAFHESRGLTNAPKRCKTCRRDKKQQRAEDDYAYGDSGGSGSRDY